MRATLLTDLNGSEQAKLHGQIARAIESVYPGDQAYAETLVEHWAQAGIPIKALPSLGYPLPTSFLQRSLRKKIARS